MSPLRRAGRRSTGGGRRIEELITEFEAREEGAQELFAQLADADKDFRQEFMPTTLGEGLRNAEPAFHYQQHLEQLRAAVEA